MGKYEKPIKISQSGKNRLIDMVDSAQSNLFRLGLRIAETDVNDIDLANILDGIIDILTGCKNEIQFIASWYDIKDE